jgi:hypothetical protein
VATLRLPEEVQDTTSLLMQTMLRPVGERHNCNIEKVFEGLPHVFISGSTSVTVNTCLCKVRDRLLRSVQANHLGSHPSPQKGHEHPSETLLLDSKADQRKRSNLLQNQDIDVDASDCDHGKQPRRSEKPWEPIAKRYKEDSPSQPHQPIPAGVLTKRIRIPRCANYNCLKEGKQNWQVAECVFHY